MKKIFSLFLALTIFGFVANPILALETTMGNDATSRSNTDSRSNFVVIDTNKPADYTGRLDNFKYYATTLNSFRFVLVDTEFVVKWVSEEIKPSSLGENSYAPTDTIPVENGWNLGLYYPLTGSIPYNYSGDDRAFFTNAGWNLPQVGQTLTFQNLVQNRVYSFMAYYDQDLDDDGVLNEDDKCEDTHVDGSWYEELGTNRWQVMKDGDGVLGWYQNKPGKKGVKATEYGQDMEYTYGCNGHQILEMLTPLGESMKGHWKFGLSSSVLEEFHLDMNDGKLDGWYFIETLKVDSKVPAGIDSKYVLETDVDYLLKASGTFTYNSARDWADAEWYLKNGMAVKGDTEGSKPHVLDVSINGYSKNQDWGVYNPEHKYEMTYTGEGSKAHFSIYDSASSDNNGSITVDIYAHI